ncbi:uncharacterized protein LOC62_04G005773 [Vanrija pseudolonga]|uniref:Uncharacterized protein n=1 Tax=Vanrija pseudolonga TaxID=143232 RepID=A0AAF0YA83_9TREE|nr:hypothetical protein LOC62_04G005773 [Vanrija pseudolonga]
MSRKTAAGRTLVQMDPDEIYFTHARIRPVFTGCNKRIEETLEEILSGQTKIEDVPYITVIENFETPAPAPAGGSSKGKKGRRGDSDDEEEERGGKRKGRGKAAPAAASAPPAPYYFSLNNRRLYLFKTLKAMGKIDTIAVQVKPALERERTKYTRERCVLRAKIMGAGEKRVGEGEGEEEDGEEEER